MKKEMLICIIVITLVVIGNIVTQNNTKKCVAELNGQLEEIKEKITIQPESEKERKMLKEKSEEIKDNWDNMQETLSFYIEHDELEKVETQLVLLLGEMETKLYEDAIPEIEKCQFILEHIADKTALNIKNIF